MNGIIAYYCECGGNGHKGGCTLLLRLHIKEIICKKYNLLHYVPEKIEMEIDEYFNKLSGGWVAQCRSILTEGEINEISMV